MPKLTKRLIEDLSTPGPRIELWDTQTIGLGVRVTALGRKTFTYRYTYHGTGYRRTLGEWPALSLDEAREKATALRLKILQGEPPHLEGEPSTKDCVFVDLADRFLRHHIMPKLAASTVKSYRWILKGVLIPAFGPLRVAEIEAHHVEGFHASLSDSPRTANLAVSVLSKMMELAERWGYRPRNSNPCLYLDRNPENQRDRHLSEEELARLWKTLDQMDATGSESIWLTAAVRFALLTGCRKSEIVGLEWRDVDLGAHTYRLRKHKTVGVLGPVLKHLSKPAWDLLQALPRKPGVALVFPGQRPGCRVHLDDGWFRIRAAAKLQDVHFHDLRHTFGTLAGSEGLSLHAIGGALNQTSLRTTQRYTHRVAADTQAVNDKVGAAILKAARSSAGQD
jgi:integrase